MADTEELVGPAVFLLSEASSYCTAAEVRCDGGACAW
jgi:NAD(P)-dependent dehydrogenase (short-subunit alcohol dehydrogenase family)